MRMGMLFTLCLITSRSVVAGDWPQILGPSRNGVGVKERLADSWPNEGPKLVWRREVGSGFSGVAVADGIAVLFHRVEGRERVEAMHADTGKPIWTDDAPAKFVPSYTSDSGPRSVPLIHKGRVYVYGALGVLRCLELKTGKEVWQRDTFRDYCTQRTRRGEPPEGFFGIGNTPIVVDDKLIVNVGGDEKTAGIVAFSLTTGKTLWTATDVRASYSSPIFAKMNGEQHVIFAARFHVISVNPQDGSERFRIPFGRPGPNVTAATPLMLNDHLFVTASYNFGAVFAKIGKSAAEVKWESDEVLSSQYSTGIATDGKIIGIHGRQDVGASALRCIDPMTKKVVWEKPDFGYATLIAADGKLIIVKTDGECVLAEQSSKEYRELDRARILPGTTRALPALANGKLYVRDDRSLKCVELSQ